MAGLTPGYKTGAYRRLSPSRMAGKRMELKRWAGFDGWKGTLTRPPTTWLDVGRDGGQTPSPFVTYCFCTRDGARRGLEIYK